MKRLVKICTALLAIGLMLCIGGAAAGGVLYSSWWDGQVHPWGESISRGSALLGNLSRRLSHTIGRGLFWQHGGRWFDDWSWDDWDDWDDRDGWDDWDDVPEGLVWRQWRDETGEHSGWFYPDDPIFDSWSGRVPHTDSSLGSITDPDTIFQQAECLVLNLGDFGGRDKYTITTGDAFSITGSGSEGMESFMDEDHVWYVGAMQHPSVSGDIDVTITLPADLSLSEIEINAGASLVTIDDLKADEISLNAGAASVRIQSMTARECSMVIGISDVYIDKLSAQEIKAECGMGTLSIGFAEPQDQYTIYAEANMGTIRINGETFLSNLRGTSSAGHGPNRVELVVVGEINLLFPH